MELSQAISSLSVSIRKESGCLCCNICRSLEDENRLFLFEQWDTQENLMTHLRSVNFSVIRGTMSLLKEPYERLIFTSLLPEGIDEI